MILGLVRGHDLRLPLNAFSKALISCARAVSGLFRGQTPLPLLIVPFVVI